MTITATMDRAKQIIERHNKMKIEKQPWITSWQLIAEYVFQRRADFTAAFSPGQFLTTNTFDSTASRALEKCSAAINAAMWPSSRMAFRIKPPRRGLTEDQKHDKQIMDWYNHVKDTMVDVFDEPEAGYETTRQEFQMENCAFGTAGIAVFETDDPEQPVLFVTMDCKRICIDEGANGKVDTVFIEREMTIRQAVQEYGEMTLHEKTRQMYHDGKGNEKIVILHAIEPRPDAEILGGFGNKEYPVASVHIEVKTAHIVKESGFKEMPIFVSRFFKCMNEIYGRSPGFMTMPDILTINALSEAILIATEKTLDPVLAVSDDGVAGGEIDTSAGAVIVRRASGRNDGGKWIEPVFTVGDMKPAMDTREQLKEDIAEGFYIDRLLDLNNHTRMTAYETNVRDRMRGQALSMIFTRLMSEIYTPMLRRVFNICLGKKLFGYTQAEAQVMYAQAAAAGLPKPNLRIIPQAIVDLMVAGKKCYEIEYISPAARIMRAEELMGVQQAIQFIEQLAAYNASVFDSIDMDKLIEIMVELTGCPREILLDNESIKKLRESRAQSQAESMAVQQEHIKAQTARGYAQAQEAQSKAAANGMINPASGAPPLIVQ